MSEGEQEAREELKAAKQKIREQERELKLKAAGLLHHRRNSRPARKSPQPPEVQATGPGQVFTWDITWLPSPDSP